MERDVLREAHPVPEFDHSIGFDADAHVYFEPDSSFRYPISVTGLIGRYAPPFDEPVVAARCARSSNPRYAGRTVDDIRAEWATIRHDASSRGTLVHELIEHFFKHGHWAGADQGAEYVATLAAELGAVELEQFHAFYRAFVVPRGWVPWRSELRIASRRRGLAGAVDMLFWDPADGCAIMADWKCSKRIDRVGWGKLLPAEGPLAGLPACNFTKYTLQQNVYTRLCEEEAPTSVPPIKALFMPIFHRRLCREATPYELYELPRCPEAADWLLAEADLAFLTQNFDTQLALDQDDTLDA